MTAVRLHYSNRLEVLAAALAELIRRDPGDPFAPERVVVPHPTMGRWLALELARALGIAANVRFEPPAEFAWSIMRGAAPELSREQPFSPARLRWRIHDVLPGFAHGRHGAAVRGYLADGDPRKRFELADRLARVFDRCLLYRPDWIREWERGAAPHWQARLWQVLAGDGGRAGGGGRSDPGPGAPGHWVAAIDAFRGALAAGRRPASPHPLREPDGGSSAVAPNAGAAGSTGRRTGFREGSSPPLHMDSRPREPHPPRRPDSGFETGSGPGSGSGSGSVPSFPEAGWPRRASFFAIPALSPSYLEMLCEAGREIELHLFTLNPCREYWGDVHSRRELDRKAGDADPEERYLTEGNELLAAWGRAGRDTFDALVEAADAEAEERFVEPEGSRRLAAVQRDVLELRLAAEAAKADGMEAPPTGTAETRGAAGGNRTPEGCGAAAEDRTAAANPAADVEAAADARLDDDSIQIHVCHSPVREAEVLHDRLLGVFDTHPGVQPADVLVLTPDLEVYGPAVEAVFGAAGRIPFQVARSRSRESRTLRAFLGLLDLFGSRLGAEAVLAPLEAPAVRAGFGMDEADLPAIRAWVREAGIRWGADEAHRGAQGLPETAEHTWRHGLRRLVLGHAMADAAEPFAGIVPCPLGTAGFDGGAEEAERLGRFLTYAEEVCGLDARLAGERRAAQWAAALRGEFHRFFADGSAPPGRGAAGDASADEIADEAAAVRGLIADLEHEAASGDAPAPFTVVRDVFRESAGAASREPARLADGVTVAGLAPGRVFPAEVVCVIGLNDGAFPRSPSVPSFDLVAAGRPRRGDRDERREDRFTFLEALLAARRCFLLTYTGRGLRDDAPIPPSVVVDELRDYLARRFPGAAAGTGGGRIETRHPLQPFSPRYFSEGRFDGGRAAPSALPGSAGPPPRLRGGAAAADDLFSYSPGMCEAARALQAGEGGRGEAGPPERFAGVSRLPEPDDSFRRVDLADLIEFFANPVRFFVRTRLGARLEAGEGALDEDEPFALDRLERHRLRADVRGQIRAGVAPERAAAFLRGSGRLPHGGVGRVFHERTREEMEALEERIERHRGALDAPPRAIDFALGGFRVVGSIEHAGADEMVWSRAGRLRPQDRIEIRLRQLALAAAEGRRLPAVGVHLDRRGCKATAFAAPDERSAEQLERWLDARWRGLAAPLPFFPETSFEYAKAIVRSRNGDAEAAREKARGVWYGGGYRRGEHLDPYFGLVYEERDPVTPGFEELAMELLAPLVEAEGSMRR